jgi:hypothetical protein
MSVVSSNKKDLKYFADQPPEGNSYQHSLGHKITIFQLSVLIEFCKSSIDYLNNGPNEKKYAVVASMRFIKKF